MKIITLESVTILAKGGVTEGYGKHLEFDMCIVYFPLKNLNPTKYSVYYYVLVPPLNI